jgi:hypothetical protein
MSTRIATEADFAFFDELALHRWPDKTKEQRDVYRELVETGEIQIETLLENTLAIQSEGMYERVCKNEYDFSDGSDAKKSVSQPRTNYKLRGSFRNDFKISKVGNKIGMIRAMCYSTMQKKFYYFAIPRSEYQELNDINITLDSIDIYSINEKAAQGVPQGKWAKFMVPDFKTLAIIKDNEATINADNNAEITSGYFKTPKKKKSTSKKATDQSFKSLFG